MYTQQTTVEGRIFAVEKVEKESRDFLNGLEHNNSPRDIRFHKRIPANPKSVEIRLMLLALLVPQLPPVCLPNAHFFSTVSAGLFGQSPSALCSTLRMTRNHQRTEFWRNTARKRTHREAQLRPSVDRPVRLLLTSRMNGQFVFRGEEEGEVREMVRGGRPSLCW